MSVREGVRKKWGESQTGRKSLQIAYLKKDASRIYKNPKKKEKISQKEYINVQNT